VCVLCFSVCVCVLVCVCVCVFVRLVCTKVVTRILQMIFHFSAFPKILMSGSRGCIFIFADLFLTEVTGNKNNDPRTQILWTFLR
jgi:hypothetical protein